MIVLHPRCDTEHTRRGKQDGCFVKRGGCTGGLGQAFRISQLSVEETLTLNEKEKGERGDRVVG